MTPASPARRFLPEVLAVLGAVVMLLTDVAVYRPVQARMVRAERSANELGFSLDPGSNRVILPIQVNAFVMDNSMPETEAAAAGRTGALAADLLEELTRVAGQSGLVVTATDPGLTVQQPTEVLVRARLKARGSYSELLRFIRAIGSGEHLMSLDRFVVSASEGPDLSMELWLTRHVLKRIPTRRAP
jgi:hypothetical protein